MQNKELESMLSKKLENFDTNSYEALGSAGGGAIGGAGSAHGHVNSAYYSGQAAGQPGGVPQQLKLTKHSSSQSNGNQYQIGIPAGAS